MQDGLGAVESVLVLGGTSEIACATLRRLVQQRTRRVTLAGRDLGRLGEVADDLRELGATTVDCIRFDAGELASHDALVEEAFSSGDVDVVLAAFGILGDQDDAEQRAPAAVEVARVNYLGAVSLLTPVAEHLRAQGHGIIVVLSSVAGERIRRSNYVYGSSKAALDAFAQGLRERILGSGVHVLIVRPGFVRTKMTAGMTPAPLATTPEAVADAIVEAIAARRSAIWVPAVLRPVMSALRHVPQPVFRRLAL